MLLDAKLPGVRIHTACSLSEALINDTVPDIIVLDIKLPDSNGLTGLIAIKARWPEAKIIVLSSQDDESTQRDALMGGAVAFVSKADTGGCIVEMIGQLLPLPANAQTTRLAPASHGLLSKRQYEVLHFLNLGLTNKAIGQALNISDNTVRRHVQDIFAYFEVATRTEAVFAARRQRMVQ